MPILEAQRPRRGHGPTTMTEPTPPPEPNSPGSLVRDVAVIVLVGIALGAAHNAYLLGSGPRAGLSWIKAERRLVKLEDVLPAQRDSATALPGSGATAAAPGVPAHERQGAPAKPAATAKPGGQPPAAATSPPASPSTGTPATDPPAAVATPAADVPAIPETREPLETGLAIVRRLYAANAAVFVDARTAGEYAEGHIAGALHLSFDDVFRDPALAKQLDDRGLPIVTYCGGGDCDLSRNLAFSLIDAGHKRVLVFLDGLPAWEQAGLPVHKGPQP